MRTARIVIALIACGLAGSGAAQTPAAGPERPRVALTVVTLDQLRQGQAGYARATIDQLGDARWGRFRWAPPVLDPVLFASCIDDRMDRRLDYCIRFYVTRAEIAADAPPLVVVVFDDEAGEGRRGFGGETLRASCFGRGVVPADAAAQDTWMWPGAARMHGMTDLERDADALAACISAAAGETWTGLRQPDPSS